MKQFLLTLPLFLLLVACSQPDLLEKGSEYIKEEKYDRLGKILESALEHSEDSAMAAPAFYALLDSLLANMTDLQTGRLKPSAALQYVAAVTNHAKRFPEASQSPALLYKGAEIARSIESFKRAVEMYRQIETDYPDYEKASTALFMRAFTFSENLQNEEKARKIYQRFIKKYPDDSFADDAALLLETLGKSDEEIFQQLTQDKDK